MSRSKSSSAAVVESDQEVGDVVVGSALVHVRDREPEVVVLHVGFDVVVVSRGSRARSCSQVLPVLPSRVTWETSDFSVGHGALARDEVDLGGRADRVEAVDHRTKTLAAVAPAADDCVPDLLARAPAPR